MHKYHIADVLTSIEFVMAAVVVALTVFRYDAGWVFIAFAVGELCDAFDGICARRWHYPNDGKKRWWRVHAPLIDQISDVVLGLAVLAYLVFVIRTDDMVILSMTILGISIPIQFIVNSLERRKQQRFADGLVIFRRYLYIFGLAAVAVILIHYAAWPAMAKEVILGLGVAVGIVLWFVKADRRKQNRTPL